jgi:type II secretion system (T2SS) protein M
MSNRDRIVVGVLACVVAVAGFWFVALKPKRAEATTAKERAAAAQTQLQTATDALASATVAKASFETDYATIAKLGKAVPDDDDSASLVFQIETAARKAGIDFRSLTVGGTAPAAAATTTTTPAPADTSKSEGSSTTSTPTPAPAAPVAPSALPPGVVAGSNGMNQLPFTFVFDGDYFNLTKLLDLLRSFTTTKGDTVTVRGRLMTIQGVNLERSRKGFPDVKATVSATAYLSSTPIVLPGGAATPAPASGATTPATTAPATQAAGVAKNVPTATAIPGAVR